MTDNINKNALPRDYKLHWYAIKSILGQGGFGITYLAYDLNLEREVAIKEYMPAEFAHRDEQYRVHALNDEKQALYQWGLERFISEARTLSKFEHPNIVKVHAVFEENGTGYMVMSYEYGQSLQNMLDEHQTLEEDVLLRVIRPLMSGLDVVHSHNFIHRDIKPDNIFIRKDGTPVLLDFGSARQSLSGESTNLTVLVTPGYAPVEQYYSNSDEQGPWTDIYGMGATLYRAVTGTSLTNAVDRSKLILNNHEDSYNTAMSEGKGRYSPQFLAAIDIAIAFKPEDRPQNISEWLSYFPQENELGSTQILTAVPRSKSHSNARMNRNVSAATAPRASLSIQAPPSVKKAMVFALPLMLLGVGGGYFFFQQNTVDLERKIIQENKPIAKEQATSETVAAMVAGGNGVVANNATVQTVSTAASDIDKEQKEQQEQERLMEAERLRLEQEKQALAAEKQRVEDAREQARLAELKRQQEVEEQRQQRLKEQQREERIVKKIAASQPEFDARYATKVDSWGYLDVENTRPLSKTDNQKRIKVNAKSQGWQSSGVQLQRGATYKIVATGSWKVGSLCNQTDASGEGAYGMLCLNLGGQTVSGYSHSALIGKISQGTRAFYVGEKFEFTASRNGVLYFMSNDTADYMSDNALSLSVVITLMDVE